MCFIHMLHVYVLNILFSSNLCCFKCFMLQVFHESHGVTTSALGDGSWRDGDRQMGRTTRLGPANRALGSCLRGKRRGQGEGVAGAARVRV
jgi:hypothetical protein